MLNRQKVLLSFLNESKRPVNKLELVKWCFLLLNETPTEGGSSFYRFVPYKFGPFSFNLYQEMNALIRQGIVREEKEKWEILDRQVDFTANLDPEVEGDVLSILRKFQSKKVSELIDYTYSTYPWFTINSVKDKRCRFKEAKPAVFTCGYEGMLVDEFLNLLLLNGIRQIIDVRSYPVSRRYGFHKSTLSDICSKVGINYLHFPSLGIRSEERKSLQTYEDYQLLFRNYISTTLAQNSNQIKEVANLMHENPSVLLCMESDPDYCHRSFLASVISKNTNLPIVHLRRENGERNRAS